MGITGNIQHLESHLHDACPGFSRAALQTRGRLNSCFSPAVLAIPLFGGGTELQLGARAEGWFDQVTGAASGATCTAAPQLTAGGCTKSWTRNPRSRTRLILPRRAAFMGICS